MCDLFGNKLYKVRDQLMKTWVASYTGQSCDAVFIVTIVKQSAADFSKV